MSVSDHLTPLSPQVSVSSPQPKKHLTVPLPLPNSLSSPVIKKKVIQIPSFDCQGLVFEKNSSRPFAPICPSEPTVCVSSKTPSQASISERYQLSQTNDGERPATLPRTKLKTNPVSPFLSTRPNNSFIPIAPKPNSSPTLPTQKLKPSNYLNLPASQTNVSSSLSQHKTSISPTLRLSPSPTAMSQMMPFDSQGAKQSSPVAQERRAKSIPISNSKTQPESGIPRFSKESKCDVLDQNVLLDFTRSELRRSSKDILNREMYQTSSLLQDKHGLRKTGNSAKPLPMPPLGKGEIGTMPKTKSNIKERQGSGILSDGVTGKQSNCVSGGITVTNAERESQSASDELAAQSIRRSSRTTPDSLPKYYTQPQPASVTYHQSCTDMQPNRSPILSTTPKVSSSTASLLSQSNLPPTKEARRRHYDLHTESSAASTFSKSDHYKTCQVEDFANTMSTESSSQLFQQTSTSRNTKAIQKPRSWSRAQCQNSQMDPQIAVSHSDCMSVHNGSQSKNSDRKPEAPRYGLPRLNKSKTGPIVAHQIQEASQTPSFESQAFAPDTSLNGKNSKLFSIPKTNLFDYEQSVQNINLRGVDPRDLGLNQTDLPAPPDHKGSTKPREYSLEKCTVSWPPSMVGHNSSNTTGAGTGSKGVFESPFQPKGIDCQKQNEVTTVTFPSQTPHHPLLGRVYIAEDPEDPYYVTMYHPGSVYVSMDMSDIVPPEVKPKPAVPAKPPHVGAPSPSSPFPPQGPGFGGAAPAPAPPPSAIPVLIGGHGGLGGTRDATGQSGGQNASLSQGGSHSTGSHNTSGGSTLLGYIGIDTIIEQMRKKTVKTGFDFNIMVVGNSGLGKSTLINTLFKSQISRRSGGWARDEKIPKTVEIKSVAHFIEEGGVKMKLTVIDTPGFGDLINNDNCWDPIAKYINEQYEKFLKEEVNITRKKRIPDTRVHCCLYFISPTGHSLRQLDIEFMKRLSHSVNIIPVIAKADTMTIDERQDFKQRVRKELEMSGIEFYPQKEFDEDMEDKSENDKIREATPFAVVGSDKEYQVNNKRVLGRKTPWGVVEVENPNHCEFSQLRDFLIRSHLQDLKEVTHNIHYETYRAKRLNANGGLHPICSNDTIESNL